MLMHYWPNCQNSLKKEKKEMNENTTKILEQIAQKMGTTSEYLWQVLLRQAPIEATSTLIQSILILLLGWGLYKIHCKLTKEVDGKSSLYHKYEEKAGIPMFIGGIAFLVLFICAFCCIDSIVNGYFNPEFWALEKVMSVLKKA